ncbi:gluconate kinase (SKI family) [Hoeflea halophila]|uniref:Gluconokinase n=1 Tax=Hoeflea halophila TaxID=714899 RepID=A0A286IFM2_9HYPH|nr:gluconokinase [Hoeflea halophila]SOE18945.1 gluconate kinase (SKI family) [Hoeflea halophila]
MTRYAIIMGVSGCGKTSVGEGLAQITGIRFMDGDALHPKANIDKMSAGIPLTDEDRWPWLERIGREFAKSPVPLIIGCSALKRGYRDLIRHHAGAMVSFIHLSGSRQIIARRTQARKGHFMPPALLDSQFAALEPPTADENSVSINIDQPLATIIAQAARHLEGKAPRLGK